MNKRGGLASGYPGGRVAHRQHLEQEGLSVSDDFYIQNISGCIWSPFTQEYHG